MDKQAVNRQASALIIISFRKSERVKEEKAIFQSIDTE